MTLLQLPPELLFHIFAYLGFEFFAQDPRRLAVSRKWHALAWKVFARDVHLTTSSLKKATDGELVLARIQPYIVGLSLHLEGRDVISRLWPGGCVPADSLEFAEQVEASLTKLAAVLQQCEGVRSLAVTTRGLQRSGLVITQPLADLFSVRHLTSLEVDTVGWNLRWGLSFGAHLCRSINAALPSLRRLRCRMDSMCEALLEPPPGDAPIPLDDVIVNLSLAELPETVAVTTYRYVGRCRSISRDDLLQLKEAMEAQATALSLRLGRPRRVRVISHEFPSF
jgi:hypothetical protein